MKSHRTKSSIGKPWGNCTVVNRNTGHEYWEGSYTFEHGVVTFYREERFATFSFVYRGKLHGLSVTDMKSPLTRRQLTIMAGKFGRKVVSEHE